MDSMAGFSKTWNLVPRTPAQQLTQLALGWRSLTAVTASIQASILA